MRLSPPIIGLAVLCLLGARPASAQEQADCDMICRLQGYLSTDHMNGAPAGQADQAAAKPRRPRAAAVRKAPAMPSHGTAVVATAAASRPAPHAAAKPTAPKLVARAVPKRPAPAVAATAPRGAPPIARTAPARVAVNIAPSPKPQPVAAPPRIQAAPVKTALVRAVPVRAASVPHAAGQDRTASLATASLATVIPGSAPAMQAGFH